MTPSFSMRRKTSLVSKRCIMTCFPPSNVRKCATPPAIRVEEWNGVQFDGAVFDVKSQTDVLRMEVNISCA